MKWVTRQGVGVDRMGSAWLIRRFIDPKAEFLFVAEGEPLPKGAEPFDMPGVRFSHHKGHCTFHTLVEHHKLADPVLKRMARIVDEADIAQEAQVEPAAPGLDLLCSGIRRISADDHGALIAGAALYDALYAEIGAQILVR